MKKCPGEAGAQREGQKRRQKADGFNLAKEPGGKAKGRRDRFSNFDGLVQPRIEMTLRCAPVISILFLGGGGTWFLIIKTITRNRLTTTTRTLLNVAAKQMKGTSRSTTIVTLRLLECVLLAAVANAIILLRVDDKLGDSLCLLEVSLPTFLPI